MFARWLTALLCLACTTAASGPARLLAVVTAPICRTATTGWKNIATLPSTGSSILEFTVKPSTNGMNGDVGLSDGWAAAYSHLATSIRFDPSGKILVRDGTRYHADRVFGYTGGTNYIIRMTVEMSTHTFSAYVHVGSAVETRIATDYKFRSRYSSATELNNIGFRTISGSLQTCYDSSQAEPIDTTTPPAIIAVRLTPATASIDTGAAQQFSATDSMTGGAIKTFAGTWSATGGTISGSGLYTAGGTTGTSFQAIAAEGGKADTSPITITSPPPPVASCPASGYLRLVNVVSAAGLGNAINASLPGDQIRLAPATYNGRWTITRSGTATNPITLCGPRTAVLNGGSISSGNGIFLNGASHWTLTGFSVTNSLGGIAGNTASDNKILSLDIHDVGQAGVHLRVFSKRNVIRVNVIHATGKSSAQYGEGVYIGTAESQWCSKTNCQPDKSDSNQVYNNNIYDVKADGIQTMAGTTGTIIRKNTINGSAMVKGNVDGTPPHWVLVMGNAVITDSNTATNALTYGMKVRRSSTAPSWATNDIFRANVMTSGRSQAAIYLETPPANGMVVYCNNVRTDSLVGPRSNVTCTP